MADGSVVIDVILDDGKVAKGVVNLDKQLGGVAGAGKKAALGIGKIVTALGLVGLASKAINAVTRSLDGAISRYDTLNAFPKIMQQIGFSAEDSSKSISRLSEGIDGLPTTLDSVASTTQRIATLTNDLEGATETTLALNNAFIASGSDAANASRGLDQYVQMLSKGEVDLQSWRTLQETMGVALNDTAKAFGYTGKSAQNDLYEALKDGTHTFDEFNAKIIELSNAQNGFADRARTASGGIKTAWTNMNTAIVKGVADVIGAIDQALGGTGSIEGIFLKAKVGIQTFFKWIVANIPIVAGLIQSVVEVIRGWLPPIDEIKNGFITAFQTIYTFVVPIVQEIVNFIMTIWGGLVVWWQENGQMVMQAVQNMMNFIWAVMQAIWPIVKSLIVDTWNAIKNTIQGAIDVILGIVNFFSALFTGNWKEMWNAVKQIFSGAVQMIWGLINLWFVGKILKIGSVFANGFRSIISGIWNAITGLFRSGVTRIQSITQAGFNFIRSIISTITNGIRSVLTGAWNGIVSVIRGSINNVRTVISTGLNGALRFVTNIARSFLNAGKNIVTSIANGIRSAISSVTDAIGSVTKRIRDFLPFSPAKEGALRDIMDVKISESIAQAIDKGKSKAISSMRDLTDGLSSEIEPKVSTRGLLSNLKNIAVPNLINGLTPAIAGGTSSIVNNSYSQNYDDGEVITLLKQIAEKDPNLYVSREKLGEVVDQEQARRTGLYGRRVQID